MCVAIGMRWRRFNWYRFHSFIICAQSACNAVGDGRRAHFILFIYPPKLMNLNYIFMSNFMFSFSSHFAWLLTARATTHSTFCCRYVRARCTRLNYPLKLRKWHHACVSWNGKTGEWQLWVKAERVGRGFHNRVSMHIFVFFGTEWDGEGARARKRTTSKNILVTSTHFIGIKWCWARSHWHLRCFALILWHRHYSSSRNALIGK